MAMNARATLSTRVRISATISLLAALAAAGCEEPELPFILSFERVGGSDYSMSPQVMVNLQTRQVMVQGSFRTPCEPYVATAALDKRSDTLRLLITARAPLEGCRAIIGTYGFRATLGHLPAATYTVRSIHAYADAGWATDSLEYPPVVLP